MSSNLLLKVGATALASIAGIFLLYKASKSTAYIDETLYTKKQLLLVLEDLRMDYTPYYIHYYHLLKALN
jgi:hypothetical protein